MYFYDYMIGKISWGGNVLIEIRVDDSLYSNIPLPYLTHLSVGLGMSRALLETWLRRI